MRVITNLVSNSQTKRANKMERRSKQIKQKVMNPLTIRRMEKSHWKLSHKKLSLRRGSHRRGIHKIWSHKRWSSLSMRKRTLGT